MALGLDIGWHYDRFDRCSMKKLHCYSFVMFHLRFGLELLGLDRKLIMIALVLLDMRFGFDYDRFGFDYCFIANCGLYY
jgi:hypothetical protein